MWGNRFGKGKNVLESRKMTGSSNILPPNANASVPSRLYRTSVDVNVSVLL